MLHRASSPAGGRERRSAPRRRGGDRRRRELPNRRPHHHDEHPWRHRLRRAGAGARSGAAQRVATAAPIPDAITALARIISKLHDDDGNVAIPGLRRFAWEGAAVPGGGLPRGGRDGRRAADRSGAARSPTACGRARPSRCWASTHRRSTGSSNQVVPVARARVSLRLAPGDDAVAATETLIAFLKDAAPWGVAMPAGVHLPCAAPAGRTRPATPAARRRRPRPRCPTPLRRAAYVRRRSRLRGAERAAHRQGGRAHAPVGERPTATRRRLRRPWSPRSRTRPAAGSSAAGAAHTPAAERRAA